MANTKTFETKIAGISFYEKDIQNNFAELNDGYNRTKTEKVLAIIIWLAVIDLIITGIAGLFGA